MNSLRAILLLIVYTAFTASTSFARHNCTEFCTTPALEHGTHTDAGLPPTECAEKEAVNNQVVEHRSGSIVKLAVSAPRNTPQPVAGFKRYFDLPQYFRTEIKSVTVPLYISNCVYRL